MISIYNQGVFSGEEIFKILSTKLLLDVFVCVFRFYNNYKIKNCTEKESRRKTLDVSVWCTLNSEAGTML